MLPSLVEHDEPGPVFISNGGSLWPGHHTFFCIASKINNNGSTMLTEPSKEGRSSVHKSPACDDLAATALVYEPDMTTIFFSSLVLNKSTI
jgi:hypothetical protein